MAKYDDMTVKDFEAPQPELEFHINEIVKFLGGHNYASPNSATAKGSRRRQGLAKIVDIEYHNKYEIKLIGVQDGSNVDGWVAITNIEKSVANLLDEVEKRQTLGLDSLAMAPKQPQQPVLKQEALTQSGYEVRQISPIINIRKAPNLKGDIVRQLKDQNAKYTIVEEQNGWGKLESGLGWILLENTKRV